MQLANDTSHNICHALGLVGFEPALVDGDECMLRWLLTPSFHGEVCLTFRRSAKRIQLSAVSAQSQIWRQQWVSPRSTVVDADTGDVAAAVFDELRVAWVAANEPQPPSAPLLEALKKHHER